MGMGGQHTNKQANYVDRTDHLHIQCMGSLYLLVFRHTPESGQQGCLWIKLSTSFPL